MDKGNYEFYRQLEEYKYINNQIAVHQRLLFQIFVFSIVASIAILGFALRYLVGDDGNTNNGRAEPFVPLLTLAPLGIILPAAFVMSAIREEIFGWGAYLRLFHETQGEGYETRLNKLRDARSGGRESYASLVWIYSAFGLVLAVLFLYSVVDSTLSNYCSAFVVMFLLLVWALKKFAGTPSNKNRQKLEAEWRPAKK